MEVGNWLLEFYAKMKESSDQELKRVKKMVWSDNCKAFYKFRNFEVLSWEMKLKLKIKCTGSAKWHAKSLDQPKMFSVFVAPIMDK